MIAHGGFEGSDPTLTAESLQAMVESGRLRSIIIGGNRCDNGADGFSVATWVQQHGTLADASAWGGIGSIQLCDLAAGE